MIFQMKCLTLSLEKTDVFHNVFKVWMKRKNTMEKLWKSSSTIFVPFPRYGTQAECGISVVNSVELNCGISVEIMWNLSDHNKTY